MSKAKFLITVLALALALTACVAWWIARATPIAEHAAPRAQGARQTAEIAATELAGPHEISGSEPSSEIELDVEIASASRAAVEPAAASESDVVLHLRGRVIDRDGHPLSGVRAIARAYDAISIVKRAASLAKAPAPQKVAHGGTDPRFEYARGRAFAATAITAPDGRFEVDIAAASLRTLQRGGVRVFADGEETLGGPGFLFVSPGAHAPIPDMEEDSQTRIVIPHDGRIELGDLVLRADERLICAGTYVLANDEPLRGSTVTAELELDGQDADVRSDDGDLARDGCRIVHNERGEFAIYADRPRARQFELHCAPRSEQLAAADAAVGAVGARDLRLVFHAWGELSGALLFDATMDPQHFALRCTPQIDAVFDGARRGPVYEGAIACEGAAAKIERDARFAIGKLPAGRYSLSVLATAAASAFELGDVDLAWGEKRELGPFDLRGRFHSARLQFHDAHGNPASGWALTDAAGAHPFGFARELEAALPSSARRLYVYVPGHRVATVELPARSSVIQLERGPLLDLGVGEHDVSAASQEGWSIEIAPLALADPVAKRFASLMQLMPLVYGDRARVTLPCAGTYRLRYTPQGPGAAQRTARSIDIDVPDAGRTWDP